MYSGKIKTIFIEENKYVQQGDTLLTIDNTAAKEKLALLDYQLKETVKFLHDLKYLSNTKNLSLDSLHSFLYQKQYLVYTQKLRELLTRHIKTKKDFTRQQKLYKKEVIAKVALENSKYNFELALNKLNHFKKQQRNQWQSELTQQNNKLNELKSSVSQFKKEQKNYIVTASISGTIQNLKGFETGNFISSGAPVAEISTDTDLIA
jgi:HlyD family secretion protein